MAGTVSTGAGVLVLLFVAYQLWGTGVYTAQAQDRLKDRFAAEVERADVNAVAAPERSGGTEEVPPVIGVPATGAPTTGRSGPPRPTEEAIAVLRIPSLGLEHAVVEGVSPADLRKGPGHYPGTALPGEAGNAAIAGHRTTYGAPFNRLDELAAGDPIEVTTLVGSFTYLVEGIRIVRPDQVEVLAPTPDSRLTLTTCHPKYSARQRLVLTALLEEPAVAEEPVTVADALPAPFSVPLTERAVEGAEGPAFAGSGFAAGNSVAPAVAWGTAAALVGAGWWWAVRRRRGFVTCAAGVLPFLAVLLAFYVHLERVLPADF